MKLELEDLFGRPVDVVVHGTVENPYRLRSIMRDLTVVYAACDRRRLTAPQP
jgi:hypothetical protein